MRKEIKRRDVLKIGGVAGAGAMLGASLPGQLAQAASKPPQVPRRVLGKTKEEVPILLLGAAVDLDPAFDPKLAEAVRYGVNYFDTADCYNGGASEPAVAAFHERTNSRKKLWITSKSDRHDPKGFDATFQQSLRKLKTDYINLYFLHALQDGAYLNKDLLRVVEKRKKLGQMKHFGFSCHDGNVVELLQLAAKTPWVDAVMYRYNFRRYGDKELNKAMDACAKAGVGLIAMKTQGSEASFRAKWAPFKQTGKWTKHQAVLKAVWADERISAAVSSMDTLEKLRQNVAAAVDRQSLSQSEQDELQRYAAETRPLACDGCDHLCGAALRQRMPIGAAMRCLMYHDVYGERQKAHDLFAQLQVSAKQLHRMDFHPASKACPNGVDIGWHMERAARLFGRDEA